MQEQEIGWGVNAKEHGKDLDELQQKLRAALTQP